ncbi:hypothetical protein AB0M20_09775 [Actinoplanes sp. NPDC051633]|uniref:hypothetical protein n=1 Tax=Actinoplanes sp. NPDC051633 TaxID=3155670 RepID=UPI00343397BA
MDVWIEEVAMMDAKRRRRRQGIGIVLAALASAASAFTVATAPPAGATSRGSTVEATINVAALVVTNLCNADVVNLSGDMTIRTTTTPRQNGGYTVQSTAIARNLKGTRIAPPPAIGYRGTNAENTYAYYAPPPYPATFRTVHYTELVPQGKAPRMYLVVIIREVIAADGTPVVPVVERAYLVCKPPSRAGK